MSSDELLYFELIDRYVQQEMNPQERIAFEKQMERDEDLQEEYRAYISSQKALHVLALKVLRQKANNAQEEYGIKTNSSRDEQKSFRRIQWLILCIAAIVLIYLATSNSTGLNDNIKDSPPKQGEPNREIESEPIPPVQEVVPPTKENEDVLPKKEVRPIAENDIDQSPKRTGLNNEIAPDLPNLNNLRSINSSQLDSSTFILLEDVWAFSFSQKEISNSPPFLSPADKIEGGLFREALDELSVLEREYATNDTLIYLKGISHLLLMQGKRSSRYFYRIVDSDSPWKGEASWFLGLALVIDKELEKAKSVWVIRINEPKLPYFDNARDAIITIDEILEQNESNQD